MTINKFLIDKGVSSNAYKITILQMVEWVDEWQKQERLNIALSNTICGCGNPKVERSCQNCKGEIKYSSN